MSDNTLTIADLRGFSEHLRLEEKSSATCEKYLRDVTSFARYAEGQPVSRALVHGWKQQLLDRGYAVRSVNSMLASVSSLLCYLGRQECRVKQVRLQRRSYTPAEKELTKGEYRRLLEAAGADSRPALILQTICATGIRVSELQYFTVEAVTAGEVIINCKGKTRTILIPSRLRRLLLKFSRKRGIRNGPIFLGKRGGVLDRSSIWRMMKGLCAAAGVNPGKVFPHNLRKLFARTFYALDKDIAKLADILGHSSINTTRIYIMTTGAEHRRQLEQLHLLL